METIKKEIGRTVRVRPMLFYILLESNFLL